MKFKVGTIVSHEYHYEDNKNYYFSFKEKEHSTDDTFSYFTYTGRKVGHSSSNTFKLITDIFCEI
jgi:hypothetical protein